MQENWKTYKLDELGTIARGKSKNRPRDAAHLYGGIYPFIQTGDVKAANHRLNKYSQTYSVAGLAQSKLWPKNTMCITIAANIAETAILEFPACFPDSIIGFIADENVSDIDFVEYLMQYFRKQIQSHSIGSVQDNINLATFQKIDFKVPPLPEQRAIASILSALDDKIELNLQTNKTLEEMAMTLYKHWFVDFGPFRDGNFVDSELGLIPEGWEVKRLGNLITNNRSNRAINQISEYDKYIGLEHLERGCLSILNNGLGSDVSSNKSSFLKEDILFGKLRPYFKKVGIAPFDGICSTDILVIRSKRKNDFGFVLFTIFNDRFIDYTTLVSGGTRMPRVSWGQIEDYKVVYPGHAEKVAEFNEIVNSYVKIFLANIDENQTLTTLRDSLLPKLISGEVRVRDAEKDITHVLARN